MDYIKSDNSEFSEWLEDKFRHFLENKPCNLALAFRDIEGNTYTAYWNMSVDDRRLVAHAFLDDAMLEIIKSDDEQEGC